MSSLVRRQSVEHRSENPTNSWRKEPCALANDLSCIQVIGLRHAIRTICGTVAEHSALVPLRTPLTYNCGSQTPSRYNRTMCSVRPLGRHSTLVYDGRLHPRV